MSKSWFKVKSTQHQFSGPVQSHQLPVSSTSLLFRPRPHKPLSNALDFSPYWLEKAVFLFAESLSTTQPRSGQGGCMMVHVFVEAFHVGAHFLPGSFRATQVVCQVCDGHAYGCDLRVHWTCRGQVRILGVGPRILRGSQENPSGGGSRLDRSR